MVSQAAQAELARRSARAAKEHEQKSAPVSSEILERCTQHASRKINELKANSKLFAEDQLHTIPKFGFDEVALGKVLGKGGFGTVNEVIGFKCKANDGGDVNPAASGEYDDEFREQEFQDKKFIADHCIREGGDARYAIKALSPEVKRNPQTVIQGTIDMAVETMFLSVIEHPHIIKMRAFSVDSMLDPSYFIVLDRLYDTLEARIPKWKVQGKRANSIVNKVRGKSVNKKGELLETKLSYAYDLMGAIEYLHKHHLVYRDLVNFAIWLQLCSILSIVSLDSLSIFSNNIVCHILSTNYKKPENVGFNVRDDIVLFDFGLVREIHEEDKLTDKTWKLTGETGSIRYMAPEVASNKPYGYSADIYSFGVMLWEILKDEKPYASFNKKMHTEMVVIKGSRPKVDSSWSPSLKGFLNSCWHQDLTKRPTALVASNILKREAAKAMGGEDLQLNNFRRKSTFVNRDSLRERSVMKKISKSV